MSGGRFFPSLITSAATISGGSTVVASGPFRLRSRLIVNLYPGDDVSHQAQANTHLCAANYLKRKAMITVEKGILNNCNPSRTFLKPGKKALLPAYFMTTFKF
jgi:hypothetical protein